MKKFSGLILALVVILALLYVGHWYYRAHQLKELVLTHLKEYEKPDEDGYHVKVGDVSIIGFPLNYIIKLSNPKYELANDDSDSEKKAAKFVVDGALKIGTDLLGKSYWLKQEGDLNYFFPSEDRNELKKYIIKGNMELKTEVAHPQYLQAFMRPFHGFPRVFYKENPSFREVLHELNKFIYNDHDFALYEVKGNEQKKLLGFTKGFVEWNHESDEKTEDKFSLNLDLNDLEAIDQGAALLPHLRKLIDINPEMAVDIPYILGSGKNTIGMQFTANFPHDFNVWNFLNYKNASIQLTKFNMENSYGHTLINFGMNLKEEEKDNRNVHFGFSTESAITSQGSKAIHNQFINGLKFRAKANDSESSAYAELLKCCEDRLQDVIPNYAKLGKMRFVFDTDIKIKDVSQNPMLDKVLINDLDVMTKPYGVNSHGQAAFVKDQPQGKYEIEWVNYKDMVHDLISYFNRIRPMLEKFAEINKQPMAIDVIDSSREKEIIDFFKSISNDPLSDNASLAITIDFTDVNDIKVGRTSADQVKEAWDKLVSDLTKAETPVKNTPAEASSTETKKNEASEKTEAPAAASTSENKDNP